MAVASIASERTIVDTNIVEPLNEDICGFEPAIAVLQPQHECASLQPLTPDVGTGITVSDQIEEVVSVVKNTPTLNTNFKEIMATPKIQKKHSTRKRSLTYKAQQLNKSLFSEKPKQSKNV